MPDIIRFPLGKKYYWRYDAGDGIAQVDLTDGEGYLSYDGSIWENVERTQNCNVCLKAYTRDKDG